LAAGPSPGRFTQIELFQTDLDGDFPAGCHADELAVGRIFDQLLGCPTQQWVIIQEPQQAPLFSLSQLSRTGRFSSLVLSDE
jgi:hypothetical protein